eukprot:Gb_39771 [translate_table: standard]
MLSSARVREERHLSDGVRLLRVTLFGFSPAVGRIGGLVVCKGLEGLQLRGVYGRLHGELRATGSHSLAVPRGCNGMACSGLFRRCSSRCCCMTTPVPSPHAAPRQCQVAGSIGTIPLSETLVGVMAPAPSHPFRSLHSKSELCHSVNSAFDFFAMDWCSSETLFKFFSTNVSALGKNSDVKHTTVDVEGSEIDQLKSHNWQLEQQLKESQRREKELRALLEEMRIRLSTAEKGEERLCSQRGDMEAKAVEIQFSSTAFERYGKSSRSCPH